MHGVKQVDDLIYLKVSPWKDLIEERESTMRIRYPTSSKVEIGLSLNFGMKFLLVGKIVTACFN
ncbi:hypothetical protein Syun_023596 [Stephania yunnanensis]|uniref:Uncharacterized protein n=1 Tax=Stephania yunnanensis TaxID=152371 RepID=A0AAP0FCE8_9MAGN